MTEPVTAPAPAQEPTPATPPAQPVEQPPWGNDFDPQKAWNLVQNLRADKEKLSQRPTLTDEQQRQLSEYQSLVEASKTDMQRKDEAAATAQQERDQAKADALRYQIAFEHGIGKDDLPMLGTGSQEELTARAEWIASKNKTAAEAAALLATPPPGAPAPRRPGEQLLPGATPAPAPAPVEDAYPSDWLSPSQRAAVQKQKPE